MPRILLHLEGLAVLLASLFAFYLGKFDWTWFAVLFLAPDLSMLGYLLGPRVGAMIYNLGHWYALPLVLLLVTPDEIGYSVYSMIALIWLSHIGFDRLLGYGLKYPTGFKDTHLQRV